MHQAAKDAISLLMRKIEYIEERHDRIPMDMIEGMFPEGDWNVDTWQDFDFTLPYDFALMKFVDRMFELCGFEKGNESVWISNESTASASHKFQVTKDRYISRFDVNFVTYKEGARCVVNKVGDETVIKPIYEVVCSEAAAKEFTFNE